MIPLNGMKKKGLDPLTDYEAIVIDINDPKQIGQIRARVMGLMDDIRDEDIPWSRPTMHQLEGLKATGQGSLFGVFSVPQRGGKVTLKFPTGSIYDSMYEMTARPNEQEMLPEALVNYPFRMCIRISSGTQIIIDRKTNEIFFNTSGDYNMTVMGDVNQTIIGNQQVLIGTDKADIPDYIRGDPTMTPQSLTPDPRGRIAYKGKRKGKAGNQFYHVKGNQHYKIDGDQILEVAGKQTVTIKGKQTLTVNGGQDCTIKGQSKYTVAGMYSMTATNWSVESAGEAVINGQTVRLG